MLKLEIGSNNNYSFNMRDQMRSYMKTNFPLFKRNYNDTSKSHDMYVFRNADYEAHIIVFDSIISTIINQNRCVYNSKDDMEIYFRQNFKDFYLYLNRINNIKSVLNA